VNDALLQQIIQQQTSTVTALQYIYALLLFVLAVSGGGFVCYLIYSVIRKYLW
jgi:hypothetical protein